MRIRGARSGRDGDRGRVRPAALGAVLGRRSPGQPLGRRRPRRAAGRAALPGYRRVQLRVAAGPARSGRRRAGTAVAAGRGRRCQPGPARRAAVPDRGPGRAGSPVRVAARGPAGARAARLPDGDVRPARHRGGRAGLPGAAAADGGVGPDGAHGRRGPLVRGRHRAGPPVLRDGGHGRRHRGAADRARRRPAHAGRGLVRLLRRRAVRAGPPGPGEPAGPGFGGPELERGPAPAGGHAGERRRAAGRLRGPAVRLRSRGRPGHRGPPVSRRARAARHAGGAERGRSVLPGCSRRAPRGRGRAAGRAHRADGPGPRG